jgi:lysophospholipase L1-like esterase
MNAMKSLLGTLIAALCIAQPPVAADDGAQQDWPNLTAYRYANTRLGPPAPHENRVVFMGDSITEFWEKTAPELFRNKSYINRGISGQTTPQMLVRFRPDVIDLKPGVVVILAGTNDIAGNTGPTTLDIIEGNMASMAELARAHGIKVVLSSVLPATGYWWNPEIKPATDIAALNLWLREFAGRSGFVYLDYHTQMKDADGGLQKVYSDDGVHPNAVGYQVMRSLAEKAIAEAMKKK